MMIDASVATSRQCYIHMVETCPFTKFKGGLMHLHSADESAVIAYENNNNIEIFDAYAVNIKRC